MAILIFIAIASAAAWIIYKIIQQPNTSIEEHSVPSKYELLDANGNPIKQRPAKLLDLNTTTIEQRQRTYGNGYRKQRQYDDLQRRAEVAGDTATLEAIRLGIYDGPLPELEDNEPSLSSTIKFGGGNSDAPIQELQYFCIKDKGYHVSVWPKAQRIGDYLEFNIAGMSHRDNIDDYLGEFQGTMESEPANPYDPNAIKVLASDGHHVGYVPKDMTASVRQVTTLPCKCYCFIKKNRHDDNPKYYTDCYVEIKY